MYKPDICAQLYTIRDACQNEKDYADSLKKIASLGFGHVQLSGGAKIEASTLKNMLDDAGLCAINAHEPTNRFADDLEKLVSDMQTLGCQYVGPGFLAPDYCTSREKLEEFIGIMNNAAKVLGKSGIKVTFHNHSHEFLRLDGKQIADYLLEGFDESIQFMADVYWLQNAGFDPHDYLMRLKGRLELVHLKDMEMVEFFKYDTAEIGLGNMNMSRIVKACEAMGTKYLLIEQDNCRRDPFESLRISRENLLKILNQALKTR